MARIWTNSIRGELSTAVASTGTTLDAAIFAELPVVAAPDRLKLTLDPGRKEGFLPEIVEVTDHAADSTIVTVRRAQETSKNGGAARDWPAGTVVVHPVSAHDMSPGLTQLIGETLYDPGAVVTYNANVGSFADLDATNLAVSFTAIDDEVIVHLEALCRAYPGETSTGASISSSLLWNLRESGVDLAATDARVISRNDGSPPMFRLSMSIRVTGLTPGAGYTWTWGGQEEITTTGTRNPQAQVFAGGIAGAAVMRVWSAPAEV